MTIPYTELLSLIDDRSAALRSALAAAPDRSARVPGCPGWTLADLVAHLGAVHRFWAGAVSMADPSRQPGDDDVTDQHPHGDLVEWSAASTELLLSALRSAEADTPVWAWWAASGTPLTAGAVARHQVQEAAVHAFDAQETIGQAEPLPAAIAVDGVAEFLSVGLASTGEWPYRPARIAFSATDGPVFTVDLSPSGVRLDPPAAGDPVATVHGPASDLVLALYGRVPFDNLRVDGDRGVLTELQNFVDND
ncbi:maleylpyruvate isomerase family mycothiol-dependent enzyme [Actinoplanes sp. NPDC048988]|uniref:maleylpyruvate isomerase family mycothiol-dependent enzyme n=1 Tax=Actinoplanes sp. NPDC048988 TaxID=3363901 RepID=UPI003714D603